MRLLKQQHQAPIQGPGSDGYSFNELDKAVCEDLHAALSNLLSTEEDYDIWGALERIFNDYRNALGYLGSQAPAEELKHASGAYRCLRACVVENCLIQDYEDGRGDSFLSTLITDDRDFRLVYVLWRWCIDSAIESSGFSDLAHQVKDIKELSGVAKSDMKRMRNAKQLTADPDSMLSAADDPNFDKLIRVVFSLLRCGRFEEAIELCGGMGVPWMTLMIRTQQMLIDSTLVGADLTKPEKARLHFRKLTYQIMKKAVAETKYSMGIRMVFAALVGDLHFLLPLATSIEDRLWCYANAAVQARLNNALELDHPVFVPTSIEGIFEAITTVETPPYYVLMNYMMRGAWDEAIDWMHGYCEKVDKNSAANSLSLYRFFGLIASVCRIIKLNNALELDHSVFVPTSIEGIFEAITTVETPPYYVLVNYMMCGAWDEAIDWMRGYCEKVDKNSAANLLSLYRFFGLIASVCRIMKYDHNERCGRDLVGRMIDVLLQKQLFSLIPFYAALLPKEEALKKIWDIMPYVRSDIDRRRFIEALDRAEFSGEDIALQFGKFRMVEEVDHLDCLRWIFVCGESKLLYAIAEANSVIRHYLIAESEKEASAVINECESLKLVDRLAALVKNSSESEPSNFDDAAGVVIDEFNNHCLYLSAQAHCTTFAMECARAQAAAKKLAEEEEGGEWSQQGDLVRLSQRTARVERNQTRLERSKLALDACKARTLDAVIAFLRHPGWKSETEADWARSEQLRVLRERFYASILNMLLRDLGMCDDATAILDLLPVLADEDLNLYKSLSKHDLRRFLLDVHALAGHAME
ncbi:hypothetical protein ANCCAN_03898 [Ancylostoma caninum]|uniref:Nuclear pore complex protein n=1 Tax=Ancylostoma caninum TaxID=29170 RepID=A0A368H494_ANCCA|nr:hypothetical protein ANCCAN_03898 [Ancylostoma caninum]